MIEVLEGRYAAELIEKSIAGAVTEAQNGSVLVEAGRLTEVAGFIRQAPGLELDYLCSITGTDLPGYFELVYLFYSLVKCHSLTLRVRCPDKSRPAVPSLVPVWKGADLQEREIYDLLGIEFTGHPNLKRIFLWEGFEGYPLRRDFYYER
jgi:NADH-quinone oxidoreductase subunit C